MIYQISYGPHGARMVESFEIIGLAADRYCELANVDALNIELSVQGMPISPLTLLKACPANSLPLSPCGCAKADLVHDRIHRAAVFVCAETIARLREKADSDGFPRIRFVEWRSNRRTSSPL